MVVRGGGNIKDDGQSAARRPIWQKGIGVAGHEETLNKGHGERSFHAHPVAGHAPALRWGRGPFDLRWVIVVGSDEAEAKHAHTVKLMILVTLPYKLYGFFAYV